MIDDGIELLESLMPRAIVGEFAGCGLKLSCIFFILNLFVPLPFHPLWGFATVPLGALVAWIVERKLKVERK